MSDNFKIFDFSETQSNPIFISSPTGRCGTTAVQRLLSTDRSISVYGEDSFLFQLAAALCKAKQGVRNNISIINKTRSMTAEESAISWIVGPLPDPDIYCRGLDTSFYGFVSAYESETRARGAKRWAMKKPSLPPADIWDCASFFSGPQIIYLERDVTAALASNKSYVPAMPEEHVRGFLGFWIRHMTDWAAHRAKPNVATINYADLSNPRLVDRLSEFLGQKLDPAPLAHRLNASSGYKAPAELGEDELKAAEGCRARYFKSIGAADYLPSIIGGEPL